MVVLTQTGILFYILLSYYYQTTFLNKTIKEKRHNTLYSALTENLDFKDNNNLTFLFYVVRIYASEIFLFVMKGTLIGQAISIFTISLIVILNSIIFG